MLAITMNGVPWMGENDLFNIERVSIVWLFISCTANNFLWFPRIGYLCGIEFWGKSRFFYSPEDVQINFIAEAEPSNWNLMGHIWDVSVSTLFSPFVSQCVTPDKGKRILRWIFRGIPGALQWSEGQGVGVSWKRAKWMLRMLTGTV